MPAARRLASLDAPTLVVADGADILGAQAQARARGHGAGHLASRTDNLFLKGNLACVSGEAWDDQEGIGGVEAHAHHVELRGHGTIVLGGLPNRSYFGPIS